MITPKKDCRECDGSGEFYQIDEILCGCAVTDVIGYNQAESRCDQTEFFKMVCDLSKNGPILVISNELKPTSAAHRFIQQGGALSKTEWVLIRSDELRVSELFRSRSTVPTTVVLHGYHTRDQFEATRLAIQFDKGKTPEVLLMMYYQYKGIKGLS